MRKPVGGRTLNEPFAMRDQEVCHLKLYRLENSALTEHKHVEAPSNRGCVPRLMVAEQTHKQELEFGADQPNEEIQRQGRETITLTEEHTVVPVSSIQNFGHRLYHESPSKIFEREYQVNRTQITAGAFFQISPMQSLFAKPGFIAACKGFKYFKADLKVRILVGTSPNYYGILIVNWCPDAKDFAQATSMYETINYDPIILDLSQQEAVEFTIPWITTQEFYTVTDILDTTTGLGPRVAITIPKFSAGSSTAPAVYVEMYASLVNPQLFGAISQMKSTKGPMVADLDGDNWLPVRSSIGSQMVQHSDQAMTSQVEQETSLVGTAANALVLASSIAAPELAPVFAIAKSLGSLTYQIYTELASNYEGADNEEVAENKDLRDTYDDPSMVQNQAWGDMASLIPKPVQSLQCFRNRFITPMHVGDSLIRHNFRALLRMPAITRIFTLASNEMTTPIKLFYRPFEVDRAVTDAYASYYEHWTSLFRMWRGSIDLEFHFYTSPLISCRVMFYWWNNVELGATDPSDYAFKKIVTIRGSTSVKFSMPYAHVKQWTHLLDVPQTVQQSLYIKVLDAPTSIGDIAASVYVVQVAAAGSDYQLTSLRSPAYWAITGLPMSRAKAQMRVRTSFGSGDFQNFSGGSGPIRLKELSEDYCSVEDFMLRATDHTGTQPTGAESVNPTTQLGSPALGVFHFVFSSFRYWRGDVKFHFWDVTLDPGVPFFLAYLESSNTLTIPTMINFPETTSNGSAMNSPSQNSVFSLQHPYVSTQEWTIVSRNGEGPTLIGTSPANTLQDFPRDVQVQSQTRKSQILAGDNFQLAFVMPPRKFQGYCWWDSTPYTASAVPT